MRIIRQSYEIKAPIEKVWQALVDPKIIEQWGGGPAVMSDEVGAKFSLWDGEIYGVNTEVVPNEKLVQDWFTTDITDATSVEFYLEEQDGKTTIQLTHERVPEDEYMEIEKGWFEYYFEPMKELLEENG